MKTGEKYLGRIIFIGLIIAAFFLFKPFFVPVVSAVILSYVFRPIFKWLTKKTKMKRD